MKILLIAPLPPPVTGHSLVSKVLLDELVRFHTVEIVNLSKDSLKDGEATLKRFIEVFEILKKIWIKKRKTEIIYLTISESFAGNLKDLVIYLICYRKLSKFFIHLHGGSIKRLLWDRNELLFKLNRVFISKLAGVIISGKAHSNIFETMIANDKIHMVPNFAQDYLFSSEEEIIAKFSSILPLRILFISNFIPKKGYNELIDAFLELPDSLKPKIRIDLAGKFESKHLEELFINKISGIEQVTYHGIINNDHKKILFSKAHIFCLPTSFFEGQPVSILEAYAAGCVVLTTGQLGILDIFTNALNGFVIQERSASSIRSVLEDLIKNSNKMLPIALLNNVAANEKYKMSTFNDSIRSILESSVN